MHKLFDFMTGDRKSIEKSYLKLYGKRDFTDEVENMKRGGLKKYFICIGIFFVLLTTVIIYEQFFSAGGFYETGGREISIKRPVEGETVLKIPAKLAASWGDGGTLKRNVTIIVRQEEIEGEMPTETAEEESPQVSVDAQIRKLVKTINNSRTDNMIVLPAELAGGVTLAWDLKRNSRVPLLIISALLAVAVIYCSRYTRIKKMEEYAKDSIIRELPEFINRLVLLLNAGLVLTSAFARITEGCEAGGKEGISYFYSQLNQIGRSMRETNGSMALELQEFAARSGVRELMRVSGIISDNIDKGAGLVEKLRIESELLWMTKKKIAEEKGRLSETKLTFPLVILLLVLIMITIAPALMEM